MYSSLTWVFRIGLTRFWSATRRSGGLIGIDWLASACRNGGSSGCGGCGGWCFCGLYDDGFASRGELWDLGMCLGRIPSRDTGIRGDEAVGGDALVRHELDQENATVGQDGPGDGGTGEKK